jgi:hypothetical protein
MKLKRREAGFYVTQDGRRAIIRTEAWEGPRGGSYALWEHAELDAYNQWCVDGYGGYRTLRQAKAALAADD